MGLDTTHDCWHGAYSSFNEFRRAIARAVGFDLMTMVGFGGDTNWDALGDDPIAILLNHSDCDGSIAAKDCARLADRMEQLLPALEAMPRRPVRDFADDARVFITGLLDAAELGEDVEFH